MLSATLAAGAISLVSYRKHALSSSGAIAALVVGTIIFTIGGWSASIVLVLFFVGGSILSKLPAPHNNSTKDVPRDWKQVLANAWLPTVSMLLLQLHPELREQTSALFLGALATAAADTFATETGIRYGRSVVSIATFRPITKGLSGGVSTNGTLASVAGALLIAVGFALVQSLGNLCELAGVNWFLPLILSGVLGALSDSWLGATFQGKFRCTECGAIVEEKTHCEKNTKRITGISWVGNNLVNAIATGIGGVVFLSLLR